LWGGRGGPGRCLSDPRRGVCPPQLVAEDVEGAAERVDVREAEADQQAGSAPAAGPPVVGGVEHHAASGEPGGKRCRVGAGEELRHRVEAGVGRVRRGDQAVGVERGQLFDDERVARCHRPPHPPQIPLEPAGDDQLGERRLREVRRLGVREPACRGELVDDRFGRDHEADPQRRAERLGERADVDDPALGVEPLDRFERPVEVPELGVVVVLDHRRALVTRELEQRTPPGG
jgi:hypothetical protein